MQIKVIGAVLIFCVCTGFGFYMAASYRRDVSCLRYLVSALDYMSSELQYHMTPLPQLMRQTASQCYHAQLKHIFLCLCYQLEDKFCNDFSQCAEEVLRNNSKILPKRSMSALLELSRSMGRFDIDGQINAIMAVRNYCLNEFNILSADLVIRLRSYRTLGICAGAAMVILFI